MLLRFILSFFIISFSLSSTCQINKIETINNEFFSKRSQITQINYISKTRYKTTVFEAKYLIDIGNYYSYQYLTFFDYFFSASLKADKKYYYFKQRDSVNYKKIQFVKKYINGKPIHEKFNLKKGQIPNNMYFLNYLPIASTNFFSKKKYSDYKLIYQSQNKDTTIVEQYIKKHNGLRKLFLDSNFHIYKIEFSYLDKEFLLEKLTVLLKIYPNTTLNSIGDSLNFGPYKPREPQKKWKFMDTIPVVYKNEKLQMPLVNDTVLQIDTSKIKYFIVDFWYLGCKPCHLLRPKLEAMYDDIDTNQVRFFGFDNVDSKEDIYNFTKLKGLKIPEIDLNKFNFHQFSINSNPTVLILDTNFKIVKEIIGYSEPNLSLLRLFLNKKNLLK